MVEQTQRHFFGSCACGSVEITAIGEPIVTNVCYCDDCQRGARQIEALSGAAAVAQSDGGVAYILFRKDRIACARGAALLKSLKLADESATNRVIATCCNSAMYMDFDDGRHWVSAYRARFRGDLPPVQMHICTKFRQSNSDLPADAPSFEGYPLRFMAKLIASWIPMLFAVRRKGAHDQGI